MEMHMADRAHAKAHGKGHAKAHEKTHGKAHGKALVGHGKAHGIGHGKLNAHSEVISAVTAQVARGFTILPGLLAKIGARLHPGRPRYLYIRGHIFLYVAPEPNYKRG